MKVKKYRARENDWTPSSGCRGYYEGAYFQMRKINYFDFDIDKDKEKGSLKLKYTGIPWKCKIYWRGEF